MKRYFKVLRVDALTQFLDLELEYLYDSVIQDHVVLKQLENRGVITIKRAYLEEVFDAKTGLLFKNR